MISEVNNDATKEVKSFELDNRKAEESCAFFKKYDRDGCELYLNYPIKQMTKNY